MKRLIAMVLLVAAGVLLTGYFGDYLLLELKIHMKREAFGNVKVRRYYAVPLKNGKIEYLSADPVNEECVHSLFPHLGDPPCWYVLRHPEQQIDL